MIYISHLVLDDDMKALVKEYGTGIESIDFSISDNLDQLSDSIKTYWEKMKEIGTRDLILHGPFLDVNPCAYDSMVREATMTRFNQCYEAGLHLGAKKIVFHSGMNPYVYYKEYWAEQVAKFWQEFMKNKTELEVPGHRTRALLFFFGCQGVGEKSGSLCKPCSYPRQLRRPGFPYRTWKRKPSLGGSAWLSAGNKRTHLDH